MNTRIFLLVLILFAFCRQDVLSQNGFSHEIGVIAGPLAFHSDYGIRSNSETNTGNVGIGFAFVHFMDFSFSAKRNSYTRNTYFNDHFKVRNELKYHKTNLQHYGPLVAADATSLFSDQLRAVSASTRVIEIGSQLEYFPLSVREFAAFQYRFAPFVSFGVHYVDFDPEASSTFPGDINGPLASAPKYLNAFQQNGDATWAVLGSIGVRYKIDEYSDIMLDSRWTYYFSDWVDGLNPSFEQNDVVEVPENKANDWIYWLNIGYIYHFD